MDPWPAQAPEGPGRPRRMSVRQDHRPLGREVTPRAVRELGPELHRVAGARRVGEVEPVGGTALGGVPPQTMVVVSLPFMYSS
ncbi:hypothetical protein SBADM41S_08195 [Streptomyces badius]